MEGKTGVINGGISEQLLGGAYLSIIQFEDMAKES